MCHLKTILLYVFIIGCTSTFQAHGADKYTDENRPYEFGFTIDGEQHRHEKKDKNGIIMGEFGFITADGVYHVTVYATDEQGRFKILSMKNIRVKPYPTSPSFNVQSTSLTTQERNPKALAISNTSTRKEQSTAYSNLSQAPLKISTNTEQEIKEINNAAPAKSCSHCSVPTTTTLAPKLPLSVPTNNNQYQQNNYGFSQVNKNFNPPSNSQQYPGQNDVPLGTISNQQQYQNSNQNNPNQVIDKEQYSPRTINQLQQKTEYSGIAYNRELGYRTNSNSANSITQKSNGGQNYQQNSGLDSSKPQAPSTGGYQQNSDVNPNSPRVPVTGGNIQQNSGANPNGPQVSSTGGNYEQNSGEAIKNAQGSLIGGNYQPISGLGINNPELSTVGGNYPQNYDVGLSNSVPSTPSNEGNNQQNSGLGMNSPELSTIGGNYPQNYDMGLSNLVPGTPNNGGDNQQNSDKGLINQQNDNINGHRNPKSFSDILKSAIPDQQYFHSGASTPLQGSSQPGVSQPSEKPVLIAAQMQLVGKDTNIFHKNPGELDGLPKGLNKDDMSHLLYTFNYTVGFHGHHEEGYSNGVKQGYYYVVGRNGVRTRVDYVADEKGFHPRISQETLDISSDDVPKPETEKDEKYGLRGYEFKWLYYPVDSRRR